MDSSITNMALVLALFLVVLYDFIKEPKLLKDRKYLYAGILSNFFLLLFFIFFIFELNRFWMYAAIGLGFIPGIYFQYLRYRAQKSSDFMRILPGIIALGLMFYIVIKVI